MSTSEMMATAVAVAKAMQGPSAPLTVNGVTYDGTKPVSITAGNPPIVNSVEEMTDPSVQYVLASTGTVWVNRHVEGYTNQIPLATTEAGGSEIYGDGKGYAYPFRISSSTGTVKEGGSTYLTGFIPVNGPSKIRLRGFYTVESTGIGSFVFMYEEGGVYNYDAAKQENTFLGMLAYWTQLDEEGKDWEVTLLNENARYIRVQAQGMDEGAIITVDEEIEGSSEGGHMWVDTGVPGFSSNAETVKSLEDRTEALESAATQAQERLDSLEDAQTIELPVWWEDYLPARMAAIRAHQDEGGKDAFSFVVMTDIHEPNSLGRRTGAVAKRVMDACGIPYALDLGDFATRSSVTTKEAMETSIWAAQDILAPIGDRLLRTRGNHDGFWGTSTGSDGSTKYYVNGYTDAEIWNRVFRSVAAAGKAVFDADGVGYYVDDEIHKARFVVLNTSRKGCAMGSYRYGQSQFDLMAKALSTLPDEGWCVMFFSHVPPVTVLDYDGNGTSDGNLSAEIPEQTLLRGLVSAFMDRETFTGSYGTSGSWDYVSIENLDLTGAKGTFAGYFAGHLHGDMIFDADDTYPFPVIVTRCDAPAEEELLHIDTRTVDTYTEHSFDVVTVVRTGDGLKLYLDKIGAGEDRELTVAG